MKRLNKNGNVLFAFLVVCLLSALCVVSPLVVKTKADETVELPTVYAENVSVTRGSGVYLYVRAKDFSAVAGLDLFVRYDSSSRKRVKRRVHFFRARRRERRNGRRNQVEFGFG